MIFGLGVFLALALALALAPGLWRQAVRATEKRLASAAWLSKQALRADKDRFAARHAIEMRRLERSVDTLRQHKHQHFVALNEARSNIVTLQQKEKKQALTITSLEHAQAELENDKVRLDKLRAEVTQNLLSREQALEKARLSLDQRDELVATLRQQIKKSQQTVDAMTIERVSLMTRAQALKSDIRRLHSELEARNQTRSPVDRIDTTSQNAERLKEALRANQRLRRELESFRQNSGLIQATTAPKAHTDADYRQVQVVPSPAIEFPIQRDPAQQQPLSHHNRVDIDAAQARETIASLNAQTTNLNNELKVLQAHSRSLTQALQEKTQLCETIQVELSTRNHTLDVQKSHIATLKADVAARDERIRVLLAENNVNNVGASNIVAELKVRNESLMHKLSNLEAQMSALLANAVRARQIDIDRLPASDKPLGDNVTRLDERKAKQQPLFDNGRVADLDG